jgi:hypothetical protein
MGRPDNFKLSKMKNAQEAVDYVRNCEDPKAHLAGAAGIMNALFSVQQANMLPDSAWNDPALKKAAARVYEAADYLRQVMILLAAAERNKTSA